MTPDSTDFRWSSEILPLGVNSVHAQPLKHVWEWLFEVFRAAREEVGWKMGRRAGAAGVRGLVEEGVERKEGGRMARGIGFSRSIVPHYGHRPES